MQGGFWIDSDGVYRFCFGFKKYDKCGGKTFRHIKTTQERRVNCDKQFKIVKFRRRDLPEYRDEIMRHNDRCWKRHRKTQYKPKGVN